MKSLNLKDNVVWNTLGTVFYQGCLWLITVLVVRLCNDYSNSGSLAFAMSIGNITFTLGTYNMRAYQVSDTENQYSAGNYVALRLITMGISAICCGLYAVAISPSTTTMLVSLAYVLFKLDETFTNVFYTIDQKHMRLDIAGKSLFMRGASCVATFSLVMALAQNLVLSITAMYLCCLLITFLFDLRATKTIEPDYSPQIKAGQARSILSECLPSVAALIISTFVVSAARQYYGVVYGEANLGIYASVATPCVIIQVLAQNIYMPILGPIAKSFNSGQYKTSCRAFFKLLSGILGIGLVISAILSLAAKPLLVMLYGASIEPYAWLLLPVLIVTTEAACTALVTDALVVFGRLKSTLLVNALALVITLIVIMPACSQWDMNGISISLICGFSVALLVGIATIIKATKSQA